MTDSIDQVLSQGEKFLLDFPAVLTLCADGRSDEFFDTLLSSGKSIVVNCAFRLHIDIIRSQADSAEKENAEAVSLILSRFGQMNRLLDSESLSLQAFVEEYARDRSACFILLEHTFTIERMRDIEIPAVFSVCAIAKDEYRTYARLGDFLRSELSYSVHPVSKSDDYLDANLHCNVGDKVFDEDGNPVLLTAKISTGAEGIVFRTENPLCVAKIYHKGVITPLRWRKLMHMTNKGITADGICWPTRLLYTFNKVPVGFLMQIGSGHTLGTVFDGPDAMFSKYPEWGRADVVRVALRVLEKVIYLHLHGVIIGDIQMKNMMMKDSDHVYLIDMDSVQIEDMPCPVGTEEYTSPELWDFSFSDILRRPVHEDFSCAILVFSILFCGQHPYAQRFGKETLREEIMDRSFPYAPDTGGESLVPIGGYDKIWSALTDRLRGMFVNAFRKGIRYEPIEWYTAVRDYEKALSDGTIADTEAHRLFPYTDQFANQEEVSDKPKTYKKSIREAIIHARSDLNGSESRVRMSSQANLMYNEQGNKTETSIRDIDSYEGLLPPEEYDKPRSEKPRDPESLRPEQTVKLTAQSPSRKKPIHRRLADSIRQFFIRNRRILLLGSLLLLCIILMMIIATIYD